MQKNKINNILFLKEIESNFIDEAIVILKDNVNLAEFNEESKCNNKSIIKEAEFVINQKITDSAINFEKFKVRKLLSKIKRLRLISVISVIIGFLGVILK